MQDQNWNRSTSAQYITDEMLAPFVKDFLPTSQIELTLSCRNLLNADIITKSDAYCIIWVQEPRWQDVYQEIARTEVIKNSLNPQWVKKVILNYNFEAVQKIKFEIWDEDIKGKDLLGRFETTLGDLVGRAGQQMIGKLIGGRKRNRGEIIIVAEELTTCKQIAEIIFSAKNLLKLSWIWNDDPFLVISRSNEDGSHSVVAKTEVAKSKQNPTFKPIFIRVTTLCNGDFDRNIKIDCYDHRKGGAHKLIGTCHTTLRSLNSSIDDRPVLKFTSQGVTHGLLRVNKINLVEDVSFLDYLRSGTRLHFAVAIDFTVSNGVFTDPKSLHYLSANQPNSYEIALRAVGEIIQQYDSSESSLFPAFGFGAKLPHSDQISHQFPLNGNPAQPYCSGIEDILHHYRNQLQVITPYGPTKFAPVINSTSAIAREFQNGKHYWILLIVTDGMILDMNFTKNAIIDASTLPMSIIIVGVGDAEFDSMNELDSDNVRLSVDGRYAKRDMVQFVQLNKFLSKGGATVRSQAELAKEVLAEIPEQLTSFMKLHNIEPQTPPTPIYENSTPIYPTVPTTFN